MLPISAAPFLPLFLPFVDEVAVDVDAPDIPVPNELLLGFKSSPDKLLPVDKEFGALRFFAVVPPAAPRFDDIFPPADVSGR